MQKTIDVPDIGEFTDVEIIEIHVKPGDRVKAEDPLISLESDKATLDVPSPEAGIIKRIEVQLGDRVSEGSAILTLQVDESTKSEKSNAAAPPATADPVAATVAADTSSADNHVQLVVLGSGPGGYTAAFRAADLGLKTILIERYPSLGGVCLNVGCIPSKALLHSAKVISEARAMEQHGITFPAPQINLDKLRRWKEKVIGQLTGGLAGMAKQRKVDVVQGVGQFSSAHEITVINDGKSTRISFDHAIIAAGSQSVSLPGWPDDPRIIDSTGALELKDIPKRMLVVGGGIIGLEMAMVYHELGSQITIVEFMDSLIPGADKDIVKPLQRRIQKQYENIFLQTKVTAVEAGKAGLKVFFEGKKASVSDVFDCILLAVGRKPNGHNIGAEAAGVAVDEQGFISVDKQQRSNVPHIFAIGDIVGQPMLAHKATHEGKVAAEVAAGENSTFVASVIPGVAYTDPEIAWVGVTEEEAKQQGLNFGKASFPWAASGRSLSLGRNEGLTKLLFDEDSKRLIGAGIVGPNAGDLIAEAGLAIEMGCDAEDIGLTIHPHPTLSETIAMAAEAYTGTITDLYLPKRKQGKHL